MPNVLITTSSFGKHDPRPVSLLGEAGLDAIINPFGRKLTENEVADLIETHQPVGMVAGVEPLTARVLNSAKHLKVISRCGIGMDSIDMAEAEKRGILLKNTPDAPTMPVAELTLGLILGLLRRIHVADASLRAGHWTKPMGNLLYKKTVGIIGCGRIGKRLAELLSPFNCIILGHDCVEINDRIFRKNTLNGLLKDSDIVTLHLPYTNQTHHFINAERIRCMKPGSYLINAARGGLVDEQALLEALSSGRLAGAALDCLENEPYQGPLSKLDNVLLTTHIGSYAKEGRVGMEIMAVANLIDELKNTGVLL